MTESKGLAAEEVESQVTIPIESMLNGLPDLIRLRSSSGAGISIIYAEFDWGTDPFKNRQYVSERLDLAKEKLPAELTPVMLPSSSIMGEIMFVGLTSKSKNLSVMQLRTEAEWVVRPRLLAIAGVAQVIVMGGELKQYQILISATKLKAKGLTIEDLKHSLSEIGLNSSGGFIEIGDKEYLIKIVGRIENENQLKKAYVGLHLGNPILLEDIAEVKIGAHFKRGDSSVNAQDAVVMTIQKQPNAETIGLTQRIEKELKSLEKMLPPEIEIHSDLFKQAHFIQAAIHNVMEALRDGSLIVILVLFFFLGNFRVTLITMTAIPLSFAITALIFEWMQIGVNTMTLGGLAVAIGELVDDAIVDVENVFRRLKENSQLKQPKPILQVIYLASQEVRNSIVVSTFLVILVFIPFLFLKNLEGRLFAPMGYAYIISILASLLVSLTLTPVLCYFLIGKNLADKKVDVRDGKVVLFLKRYCSKVLNLTLDYPKRVLTIVGAIFVGTLLLFLKIQTSFLPEFNEGTATLGLQARPGISLNTSNQMGKKVEKAILEIPEVKSTTRRVGRAEMDEHAEGVNWNEIDVDLKQSKRSREEVFDEMRAKIQSIWPEVAINIGQPISHRLEHMLSGVRAELALKIFGPDLPQLRNLADQVFQLLQEVQGLKDLQVEPIVEIPQVKIEINKDNIKFAKMSSGTMAKDLEAFLNGIMVGEVIENLRRSSILLRLDDKSRSDPETIKNMDIALLPTGDRVKVKELATVYQGVGPNMINREGLQRRIIVSANLDQIDLTYLNEQIETRLKKINWPKGYYVEIGGQFEAQSKSIQQSFILALASLMLMFLVLYSHFGSLVLSLQVLLNIPLALIGSTWALFIAGEHISMASVLAFVTLCGIASRNGIMLLGHYLHLMHQEGEKFGKKMIIRGTLERLVPVLMTASTAILALLPLLLSKGQAGKEILHPVAVVITGGLITSTLLDLWVTPAVFLLYGEKASVAQEKIELLEG